jgi:hypothetical protein
MSNAWRICGLMAPPADKNWAQFISGLAKNLIIHSTLAVAGQ